MKVIIDRIEEQVAIVELENGEMLNVPYALLSPMGAKEGDVVQLCIDQEESQKRKQKISSLLKNLFQE